MSNEQPVKVRLKTIRDVLLQLNHAKSQQDSMPKNPSAGKGVWISFQLWRALSRQLQSQISEIQEWDKLLVLAQQEAGVTRQQASDLEQALLHQQHATQQEVAGLESRIAQQEATMHEQQTSWAKQKDDLTQQTERALKMLQEREQVAVDNAHLLESLRQAQMAAAQADVRVQEAEQRAAAIQQQSEYFVDKSSDGRADRTALAHQVRDLSLALSHARAQAEQYRQQQGIQQRPTQELLSDLHRLKVDNERLVGLLSETKAWKRIARDLSIEGGAHYVPVEEALVHKGGVGSVYTPLKDRPFVLEKVAADPEEDWHWVPKQAVSAALEAINMLTPAMPKEPVLHVLLSLNKIWRQREEKKLAAVKQQHAAELRELHKLYRQRAPYEAVVGNTRLADLKKQLRLQAAHAQQLAAAAAGSKQEAMEDGKMFLALGLDSINSLNQQVARLQSRNMRLSRKLSSVHKQQPLCPACSSLALLQAPRASSSPALPSMPPPLASPGATDMTHLSNVPSGSVHIRTTTPAAAKLGSEDHHYKSTAAGPGALSKPHQVSRSAEAGPNPHTAAAAAAPTGTGRPAYSQVPQFHAPGTASPPHAASMPLSNSTGPYAASISLSSSTGPHAASLPLSSSTSPHAPQAPMPHRPPYSTGPPAASLPPGSFTGPGGTHSPPAAGGGSAWARAEAGLQPSAPSLPRPPPAPAPRGTDKPSRQVTNSWPPSTHPEPSRQEQWGSTAEPWRASMASLREPGIAYGSVFGSSGEGASESGGSTGSKLDGFGSTFLAGGGGQEEGGATDVAARVQGRTVGAAAVRSKEEGCAARDAGAGAASGDEAVRSGGGLGVQDTVKGGKGEEGQAGLGAAGREVEQSMGAGIRSSGNSKADNLVRLIQRYEQPVLRFSLWDRDGRLMS